MINEIFVWRQVELMQWVKQTLARISGSGLTRQAILLAVQASETNINSLWQL
jgi:hypothetical protein